MEITAETFIPILFNVLIGFMVINMIINFILLLTRQKRIYKLLALYWPSLLVVFIMHATFQAGNLQVAMGYSASLLPLTIWSMIGFEVLGRKFPLNKYLIYYSLFYPITYIFYKMDYGFTAISMPFAIATATPLIHTFYLIYFKDRRKSTRLQKILGVTYLLSAVHCINFSLFRMDPGAQLWGWLVAYALYDSLAILLPSIALEEANISENERLRKLVNEKTAELNESMKQNENLLKVVLHDISSPLMTMRFYLSRVEAYPESEVLLKKAIKSHSSLEMIIQEIKNLYGKTKSINQLSLKPVQIEECFNEVHFIYAEKLQKKNITLLFNNQLSSNTKVLADQTSLTHSVISNLVSNALKFSYPNSIILVSAKEENGNVILEVKDNGPGMPENVIHNLFLNKDAESTQGTQGEIGTGFGLSIVKTFVNSYGGQIEFDSRQAHTYPQEHGTNIKITLDRA